MWYLKYLEYFVSKESTMTQTRIDQFYKVTHNNREPTSKIVRGGNTKTKTKPNFNGSTIGKKVSNWLLNGYNDSNLNNLTVSVM